MLRFMGASVILAFIGLLLLKTTRSAPSDKGKSSLPVQLIDLIQVTSALTRVASGWILGVREKLQMVSFQASSVLFAYI